MPHEEDLKLAKTFRSGDALRMGRQVFIVVFRSDNQNGVRRDISPFCPSWLQAVFRMGVSGKSNRDSYKEFGVSGLSQQSSRSSVEKPQVNTIWMDMEKATALVSSGNGHKVIKS